MKICEYFLPCGRCDKFNRACDLTKEDLINYKMMVGDISPETAEKMKKESECNHEWLFYKSTESTGGKYIYYRCCKCGAIMMRDSDNNIYESGEWMP